MIVESAREISFEYHFLFQSCFLVAGSDKNTWRRQLMTEEEVNGVCFSSRISSPKIKNKKYVLPSVGNTQNALIAGLQRTQFFF